MQMYLFFRKLLGNGPWMLTFARRCHTPRPRRRPQRVCRNDKRSKGGRLLNLSTFSSRNKRRQRKNVEQLPSFSLPPDGVLLKIGGPRESESDVFLMYCSAPKRLKAAAEGWKVPQTKRKKERILEWI